MALHTIDALISRGISTSVAQNLASKSYTLKRLKLLTDEELLVLGLLPYQIGRLRSEGRPPIPSAVLFALLYRNRRTCCICRESKRPVIVHHINPWAESHSHAEANLAVLCQEHHDFAHTKRGLTLSLSKAELRAAKLQWEEDVAKLDAREIFRLKSETGGYARWDWLNLQRLFELALEAGIQTDDRELIAYLRSKNIVNRLGGLESQDRWIVDKEPAFWYLDFADGMFVAKYLSNIADQVLQGLPLIDITNFIGNKTRLKSLVGVGNYIAAQLPFYFKDRPGHPFEEGKSQIRKAYYRGHSLRLSYSFDAWLCLSSSARFDAMHGRKVQTVIGLVRSLIEKDEELNINISCLAAGTAFSEHPARQRAMPRMRRRGRKVIEI